LFADYLVAEYGDLDSDYVFVNLWGRPHGHRLSYAVVYDLVRRLRGITDIDFDPHRLRHTAATRLLRDGVEIEVVARLLGHTLVTMTATVYINRRGRSANHEAGLLVQRPAGVAVSAGNRVDTDLCGGSAVSALPPHRPAGC
jgi:integrase